MASNFDIIEAVVEIPRGSRNKYEFDVATGSIRLDRVLFSSVHYPTDYGFIPGTKGADGDMLEGKESSVQGWRGAEEAKKVLEKYWCPT
jgi:inorganic pyrophosphatase